MMNVVSNRSTVTNWRTNLPAFIADALGLILLLVFYRPLVAEFSLTNGSIRGATLVMGAYLAFAFSFNMMKRLVPADNAASSRWNALDFTGNTPVTAMFGILMIGFFVWIQADLNQLAVDMIRIWETPGEVHEGELGLYYMFGPVFLWFVVGALYQVAFVTKTEHRVERGTPRYLRVEFLALFFANIMIVLAAAFLGSVAIRYELARFGFVVLFLIALSMLELLFGPPRIRHLLKNPAQWFSLITFYVLLIAAAVFVAL